MTMRVYRAAAVVWLLLLSGWLVAQTDPTKEEALEGWQAPIPRDVEQRPRPEESTVGRILSFQWLPWVGEPRGARYYQNIEDSSLTVRDRARAALGRAEWYREREKYWKAFEAYRHAVDQYANYIPFQDTLGIEYSIARDHLDGKKERVWFFWISTDDKALEAYEHIVASAPYGKWAPEATYRAGLIEMRRHQPEAAVERFRQLAARYPESEILGKAKIAMARAMLDISSESEHDLTLARQARNELEEFLALHPDSPEATEARQLLDDVRAEQAEHLLFLGEFYQRHAHYRPEASRRYLGQILAEYSDTSEAERAAELLARLDGEAAPKGPKIDHPGDDTYLQDPPDVKAGAAQ